MTPPQRLGPCGESSSGELSVHSLIPCWREVVECRVSLCAVVEQEDGVVGGEDDGVTVDRQVGGKRKAWRHAEQRAGHADGGGRPVGCDPAEGGGAGVGE